MSVDPDGITRAAVQAPSPLTAQLPAGDAAHAAAAALEAGNLLDGVIDPDLDMYVTSLRRVGADPDVVAAARLELARRPDMFVAVAPAAC